MDVRQRMLTLLEGMTNAAGYLETMVNWPPASAPAALKARTVQAPRRDARRKGARQRYSELAKSYFQIPKDGTDN